MPAAPDQRFTGARVEGLIREAQEEALGVVKARLVERFERELLAEVEARLSPSPAPAPQPATGDEGLWVYGITDAGLADLQVAEGVAGGAPPRLVRSGDLAAVVSTVPLDAFGEEGLERNLNDLGWLESVARAHETVLDAAAAETAVVPMRMCTIYRGEEKVQAMLDERRAELRFALEQLEGRREWGVKAIADRERAARVVEAPDENEASDGTEGSSYLERKRSARETQKRVATVLHDAVRAAHERLEELAAAAQVLRAQQPELGGYSGEMLLNGAYLVDDERVEEFAKLVAELDERHRGDGLRFELTGPWPAFHFAGAASAPGVAA
jgi:hypothetical protein